MLRFQDWPFDSESDTPVDLDELRKHFPNPDTTDNHIVINDLEFGLSTLNPQNSDGQPTHHRLRSFVRTPAS